MQMDYDYCICNDCSELVEPDRLCVDCCQCHDCCTCTDWIGLDWIAAEDPAASPLRIP